MLKRDPTLPAADPSGESACLICEVMEVMKQEPALEAVQINRDDHSISAATLGPVDRPRLEQELTDRIQQLQRQTDPLCGILTGETDCTTCPQVIPPEQRQWITINQQRETTTIARVTCPTAPRFWRWDFIPRPKWVPRRMQLPEETEHEREWKPKLIAAALCGGLGMAAYLTGSVIGAISLYAAAYVAGSWYTYGILGRSVAVFLVWWLAMGARPFLMTPEAPNAFYRALTLLVVASPCALVMSIPSAILADFAWGARRGILFRGEAAVEKLAEVGLVLMDKTGTLTTGELKVDDVRGGLHPEQKLKVIQTYIQSNGKQPL